MLPRLTTTTTRQVLRSATSARRAYAIASGGSAKSSADRDSTAGDSRSDIIRKTLYPVITDAALSQAARESPSSPTGAYHPDHLARLEHVLGPDPEVHETITRAWLTHQREKRVAREDALTKKYEQMVRACDALKSVAQGENVRLYNSAMERRDIRKASAGLPTVEGGGKVSLAEKRWRASRIEGLFPRELQVPRETRGEVAWTSEWVEPGAERRANKE
ncbi:hypothetical protein QFC21_006716 [Naganishia friedmannii]|uniref:Uncharacterized protein n=1 Tax=Naganishia friedmannii TaxID=89922 RepID=A0ACC2V0W3_9TREE|nr:hypothetical protein QFC21_006716 [Naganishia friedmannii]